MEATATRESYREVLTWLRGGEVDPNPEMEDRFLNVITTMVREKIKKEDQFPAEPEAKPVSLSRKSSGNPASLRSIIDEMRERGELDSTYEELFPSEEKKMKSAPSSVAPSAPPSNALEYALGHLLFKFDTELILNFVVGHKKGHR